MKTFKTFLAEENTEELDRLHFVDTINMIKDDCQQFLHRIASNGKFHALYTGLPTSRWPSGTEVHVRKDRAPVPTPKSIQETFDRVMKEMYEKEFRSDSFYATGSPSMAAKRGVKHLVFPIGKFDYLWSPKVDDLLNGFGTEEDISDEKGLYFDIHDVDGMDEEDKILKAFLKDKEFTLNKDLKICADKGHEAMIDCKYFYAIPAEVVAKHYTTFQKMIGDIHFNGSMKKALS